MLQASLIRNDRKAGWLIGIFSFVVLALVIVTGRFKLDVQLPFNVHLFALFNALINATVAVLLVAALLAVKSGKYQLHKQLMLAALILSVIFLVSYVAHRLFAGEAIFGDADHNGILSDAEKAAVGGLRAIYIIILITHILLAAVILPFILFTAYRALIAEWPAHKKIARYTWPLWFYVAVTGPIVYIMISPYYR
jgi:putative membrane protein